MITKKLLAILIALSLAAGLTACGSSASPDAAETSPSAAVETTTPATETALSESPSAQPGTDASAQTGASVSYPISDETIMLKGWRAYQVDIPTYNTTYDNPTMTALDEATGVHVDYTEVSGMDGMSLFNIMAASGDYADIMFGAGDFYTGGAVAALNDGVIMDLTDLMAENAPDYLAAVENYGLGRDVTDDGKYLQLHGIYDGLQETFGYMLRQDWLNALGLSTPATYDEFYNVLSAFKSEYNCSDAFLMCETFQDGEHLANGYGTPGYCYSPFSATSYLYVEDGAVKSAFTQEGYKAYLQEMNKWYQAGLFSSDFVSMSSRPNDEARMSAITGGDTGMFYVGATSIDSLLASMGADVKLAAVADPVVTPGEKTHFCDGTQVAKGVNLSLSGTCSNPEAALKLVNYLFTDEGYLLFNYGIEGQMYTLDSNNAPVLDYDFLSANPWELSPATAYKGYALTEVCVGLFKSDMQNYFYSDIAKSACQIWTDMSDNQNYLPAAVSLTTEEQEEFSPANADVSTYANESIPKFIMGELNFDSDWDSFVSTLESLGHDRILALYQSAYDRYAAR